MPDMNDPQYLAAMARIREDQLKEFKVFLENDKNAFIRIIGVAAAKNPSINRDAYKAYAHEVEAAFPKMSEEIVRAHQISPNKYQLDRNVDDIRTRYGIMIRDKISTMKEGPQALQSVAQQQMPESIFMAPVKAVYNSENGGVQWGGLIGGVLAGFLGYKLTAGAGTLVNVLATTIIGALGAYAAHSYIDPKPAPLDVPDLLKEREQEKAAGRGKAHEKGGDVVVSDTPQPDFGRILDAAPKKPVTEVADAKKRGVMDKAKLAERAAGPKL